MLHKRTNIYAILQHIFVALVILDCNSVYRSTYTDYHIPDLCAVSAVLLFLYSTHKYGLKQRVIQKCSSFFALYYVVMAIFMVISVPKESVITFIIRFLIVFPILILTLCNDVRCGNWKSILYAYSNVMLFLAVTSLVLWVFGTLLHLITPNTFLRIYWGGEKIYGGYFGLLFEQQYQIMFGTKIMRNQSIFPEGPMFSLCLMIALCIEMFFREEETGKRLKFGSYSIRLGITKKRDRRILVYSLCILSTVTSIGMILLIVVYALEYLRHTPKERVNKVIKTYLGIGVLILGSYLAYKLFLDKASSESWSIRTLDYVNGFIAWKQSPIFGVGYGEFMKVNYLAGTNKQGFSNSVFAILSQGGIVLFSVYLFSFIYCVRCAIRHRDSGIISFLIIVILEFILTLFPYTFLLLFLLSFFYAIGFMREYIEAD